VITDNTFEVSKKMNIARVEVCGLVAIEFIHPDEEKVKGLLFDVRRVTIENVLATPNVYLHPIFPPDSNFIYAVEIKDPQTLKDFMKTEKHIAEYNKKKQEGL
jgi:hypothetical protein